MPFETKVMLTSPPPIYVLVWDDYKESDGQEVYSFRSAEAAETTRREWEDTDPGVYENLRVVKYIPSA